MPVEYDLVVASKRILTPSGWFSGQVGIRGGKVVALVAAAEEAPAARRVEVGEKPVIPGVIDTHVHFRDPGYTYKEDFESGTRAAAAGGVTTVFDMPNVKPPTTTAERLRAHLANAMAKSMVDFGHIASGAVAENISELAAGGATAIKVWMQEDVGRDYPHPAGTAVTNHGVLYRVCEEVERTGLPLFIHCNDQAVYELFFERARAEWGLDFRSYAKARRKGGSVVISSGVATALEFQRSTGCRLHVLHVSTAAGIGMIRQAKAEGRPVTAEVNPNLMFIANSWENLERRGPYILGSWVPEDEAQATWEAVLDGTVDVLASDHGPHTKEEKEPGWVDMYATPGGSPTIEHYLRLLLNAVNEGRISLERVVELCCLNPAKLMGYSDRKGAIKVGADADLLVLDMNREEVLSAATSHYRCGWTPTEGMKIKGAPVMTIRRGEIIMENGNVTAEPGSGQLLTPVPIQITPALIETAATPSRSLPGSTR